MGAQSEAMTISACARGTAAFTHRPLLQSNPSSPVFFILVLSDLLFDGRSIGCAFARVNGTIAANEPSHAQPPYQAVFRR